MEIWNYIKRGYSHYWYTGYHKIAIVGLVIGLLINIILFIIFTNLQNTIMLIFILLLEKQFIIFILAYYIFFKEIILHFIVKLLPFGLGENKVYEQFNNIDEVLTNFIIENFLLLVISIFLSRFILNFIAKRYYKFDIQSKTYNKS